MSDHIEPSAEGTKAPEMSDFFDPIGLLLRARVLDAPDRPGIAARIDRFDVLRLIGSGGMGVILLVQERGTSRQYALKTLKPAQVGNPGSVRLFLREACQMKQLNHPNVVRVIEVSDRLDGPYFIMPYVERGSLADLLKPGKPLEADRILSIASQVAAALVHAHGCGVIHRDLKPANVLMDRDGNVCVADFGLARAFYGDSTMDTWQPGRVGTAPYMSPGVARGEAEDTRCDIYSFGAVLYEMLTGQLPYEGATSQDVIARIRSGPPPAITEVNPSASRPLVKVAEGAMARELRDRYTSMGDVAEDLYRIRTRRAPRGPRAEARSPEMSLRDEIHGYLRVASRRKWPFLICCALGALLAAVSVLRDRPVYRAQALLQRRNLPMLQDDLGSLGSGGGTDASRGDIAVQIRSPGNMETVLHNVGLDKEARTDEERWELYERMVKNVSVRFVVTAKRGDVFEIGVTDTSPRLAATIANALAEICKASINQAEAEESNRAVTFLTEYAQKYKTELDSIEKKLEECKQAQYTDVPEGRAQLVIRKLELQTAETAQSVARDGAARRLADVEKRLGSEPQTVVSEVTAKANPRVAELQNQLIQKKARLASLLLTKTEEHLDVKQVLADITALEREVTAMPVRTNGTEPEAPNPNYVALVNDKVSLQKEIVGADAALKRVRGEIESVNRKLQSWGEHESEYNGLLRQRDGKAEYYTQYARRLADVRTKLQIAEGQYGTHVDILQKAIEPAKPSFDPRMELTLCYVILGAVLGGALVFALEFYDWLRGKPRTAGLGRHMPPRRQ